MNELVGKEVEVEFAMPGHQWPIPGFPARAICLAVDMPMVKLRNRWLDNAFWINAACIRTMRDIGVAKPEEAKS